MYAKLRATPYARSVFLEAIDLLSNSKGKTKVERAWAVFTGFGQAFSGILGTSWSLSYSKKRRAGSFQRKIMLLRLAELRRLIAGTQIENRDACKIIRSAKRKDVFIYADPPYIDAAKGITAATAMRTMSSCCRPWSRHLRSLCSASYPSELIDRYRARNNWISKEFVMSLNSGRAGEKKTEVLTMNYTI